MNDSEHVTDVIGLSVLSTCIQPVVRRIPITVRSLMAGIREPVEWDTDYRTMTVQKKD